MVQNLHSGDLKEVVSGEITGTVYLYRTNNGYLGPGNVGWQAIGEQLQVYTLQAGQTVSIPINGSKGMIANSCPSMVQLVWDNQVAVPATNTKTNPAARALKRAKPVRKRLTSINDNLSPVEEAIQTLTAQWYNAVVTGLGLDSNSFQLVQGVTPLGTTSEEIWDIFDGVPPSSITNFFSPAQTNSFSTNYGSVINNLIPQNSNSFQTDMSDYYSNWSAYLKTVKTLPSGGLPELFQNWSSLNMPPDQAQTCLTDLLQVYQGTVYSAIKMWLEAGGFGAKKAYNATIEQLNIALGKTTNKTVSMDSSNESSDISNTWAKGEVGGFYDFFEGGGSSDYDNITMSMIKAGLNINASFDKVVTFTASPLSSVSTDPILSQYQPWFSSAALNLAYQTSDNTVWKTTHPTWEDTFGPNGNMLRTASAIVVVEGVNINMESNASFSSSEITQLQAAAEFGIFPFFEASASGGWTNSVQHDAAGNVSITSQSPNGVPIIIGVIVTPIGGVLLL
ncbi:hypothetical protein [Spirosoma linguale]|uniref:Uncharacterized protein n=1 Tax=Spirosoma linguale (strain ATCC 33905 / DSM 74 / LMG 10896 / Claus 1) TaxID=504472 RepID=D2QEI1_SPILD|nr:hypothetical protein Slin_2211 [Spirosoma linguale DSM 74]